MLRHWQTHLYTYAVALTQGDRIKPENLKGMRNKARAHCHTEGECQRVEIDPALYIHTGRLAVTVNHIPQPCEKGIDL